MIYFDNAATTGHKPIGVINAVNNALKNYSANPGRSGHKASQKSAEAVFKTREKVSDFFGATGPEKVIFTLNCTQSINMVLKGVLRKGDHVIVSSFEHNAVMRPLNKISVSYDVAEVSLFDDEKTLKEFERKIRPNTRMIVCTGASNVFGKTLPIEEIGNLCRNRGILFCVDAAQIAGVLPINMKKMNIDFLCVAAHKGLYAPMGIGILIAEKNIPNTLIEGGTGTNSEEFVQPEFSPERYESGTVNLPAILGIGAGIDFVNKTGIENIYRYELNLTRKIYSFLKENKNVELYTPEPLLNSYMPVISFNFKGIESHKTSNLLSEKGIAVRAGLHCAPLAHKYMNTLNFGAVRISTSVFNKSEETDALKKVLNSENFLKNLKIPIE